MPERTEFIFSDVGGERVVKLFRSMAQAAGTAHSTVKQLQQSLRSLGAGGARGTVSAGGITGATAASLRMQTAAINQQIQAMRLRGAEIRKETALINQATLALRKYGLLGPLVYKAMQTGVGRATLALAGLVHVANRVASRVISAFGRMGSGITRALTSPFRMIGRLLGSPLAMLGGGFATFFAARTAIQYADTWTLLGNRIAAVTDNLRDLRGAQEAVFAAAQRSRTSIESSAELYSRIALGTNQVGGYGVDRIAGLVETIQKAAVIGGGSQASVQGALIQFSQIIGAGGAARGIGQELRSIREQAPYLFQILAHGLGVTTTQMEKLAEEGKLTSKAVLDALESMSGEVERRFGKVQLTIGQAFTNLRNSAIKFVGIFSDETGAGRSFAGLIEDISVKLDSMADNFARRVNTIITLVQKLYMTPGLSDADRGTAGAQLDTIINASAKAVEGTLKAFTTTFYDIMVTGAEMFVHVFARLFTDEIRRSLSGVFTSIGLNELARSVLPAKDQLKETQKWIQEYEHQITEIQRLSRSAGGNGGFSALMGMETAADYARIGDANRVAGLQAEVNRLRKEEKSLVSQAAREEINLFKMRDDALKTTLATLKELIATLKTELGAAWGPLMQRIDKIGDELGVASYAGPAPSFGGPFVSFINNLQSGIIQLREAGDALKKFEHSLLPLTEREQRFAEVTKEANSRLDEFRQSLVVGGVTADGVLTPAINRATAALEAWKAVQMKQFDIQQAIAGAEGVGARYKGRLETFELQRNAGILRPYQSRDAIRDEARSAIAELEKYRSELEKLGATEEQLRGVNNQILELRGTLRELDPDRFWGQFRDGVRDAIEEVNTWSALGQQFSQNFVSWMDRSYDSLSGFVQGTQSASEAFRGFAASVLDDLARMIYRFTLMNAIAPFFGAQPATGLFGFAYGAAFNHGSVMPFAAGGIMSGGYVVDRPTIFPMARGYGLMGEAGPEAVMPLDRGSDGKLGVRATGAGGGGGYATVAVIGDEEIQRFVSSRAFDDAFNDYSRRNRRKIKGNLDG